MRIAFHYEFTNDFVEDEKLEINSISIISLTSSLVWNLRAQATDEE